MIIDVEQIRREVGACQSFNGSIPDWTLDFQGTKSRLKKIRVQGEATNTGKEIYVRGEIDAWGELTCSRCLNIFSLPFHLLLEETFYRQGEIGPDEEEEWRLYSGEEIDLEPAVREALLLALPMKPVCKPDCQGLCPVCGADLNLGQCGCAVERTDPRLAILADFFKQNQ